MRSFFLICMFAVCSLSLQSCVENSRKYKELQARLDSLQVDFGLQKGELDEVFATLNEVESGLRSIRESENIIKVQAQSKDGMDIPEDAKEQIKDDILAVQDAIDKYKRKIEELQKDKRIQSAQFQKRLQALSDELTEKGNLIKGLKAQLNEKDLQLAMKVEQIASLDMVVSELREEIGVLNDESTVLKDKVALQEKELYTSYYIVGSKADLIEAGVVTKGGIFKSSKVSYQAEKDAFVSIDYREINSINTNAAKVKILSVHPFNAYTLDDVNGEMILNITDADAFWEHTKYLVIQTN